MKSIKEQKDIIARATKLPWYGEKIPPTCKDDSFLSQVSSSCVVAVTAASSGNAIYASPNGGTFPASDKAFIVSASENYPALLDWAERARRYLLEFKEKLIKEKTEANDELVRFLEELPE